MKFMVSMLCVEGNIPIFVKIENDISRDEKLNNEELLRIAKLLKPLGKNVYDHFRRLEKQGIWQEMGWVLNELTRKKKTANPLQATC